MRVGSEKVREIKGTAADKRVTKQNPQRLDYEFPSTAHDIKLDTLTHSAHKCGELSLQYRPGYVWQVNGAAEGLNTHPSARWLRSPKRATAQQRRHLTIPDRFLQHRGEEDKCCGVSKLQFLEPPLTRLTLCCAAEPISSHVKWKD